MRKFIIIAVAVLSSLAVFATAQANNDGVHHPDCAGLAKEISGPGSYTVEADYDGWTFWVKAANTHELVGVLHTGDVIASPYPVSAKVHDISHVDACPPPVTTTPPPDPCAWPQIKTHDLQGCDWSVDYVQVCGSASGTANFPVSNKPTWVYGVWFSETAPTAPDDGQVGSISFGEDYNDGSVLVYRWFAGTENDLLSAHDLPTHDNPQQVTIDTDCETPTTTTQPTTTTTIPQQETTTTWVPTTPPPSVSTTPPSSPPTSTSAASPGSPTPSKPPPPPVDSTPTPSSPSEPPAQRQSLPETL